MPESIPELLAEAVRLARDNAEAGQQPFAALVVRDGEIVAAGVNTALRDADPTAHAEVEAIRKAGADDIEGAIIVASCEPCPMCQAAVALVGVSQIVYAAPKELAAQAGFEPRPGRGRCTTFCARPTGCVSCTWTPPTVRSRAFRSGRRNPEPRARAAAWR